MVCDCCKKKLQGNTARGHAFYRCYRSSDYPVPVNNYPPSLSVREDRLLPHVDAWLSRMFAPERIEATAREVVKADAEATSVATAGRLTSGASARGGEQAHRRRRASLLRAPSNRHSVR